MATGTVVVVAGGEPIEPAQLPSLPADAVVIAADSGVDQAGALGLHIDVAVGDFDSVSAAGLAAAEADGADIVTFPSDKDATDLALALRLARGRQPRRIVVLIGRGGRLDHELANLVLLAAPELAGCQVIAHIGPARVDVARPGCDAVLDGWPGELVSLMPVGGHAHGVTTTGLRYPLDGATLAPTSSLGISNELVTSQATVSVRDGTVLVILPGSR